MSTTVWPLIAASRPSNPPCTVHVSLRAVHRDVLDPRSGADRRLRHVAAEFDDHLVKAQLVHLVHGHVGDEAAVANDPDPRARFLHLGEHVR